MTKSVAQPARGDVTRGRILHAAMALAAEYGWDAVSTRQIAERADANQALIHYHFGSKEGLLHAAFDVALRDLFEGPTKAMAMAPDFATGAAALIRALKDVDSMRPEALFSVEALSRAARDETIQRSMAGLLVELRAVISARIAQGQATGELRADLDPDGTATALAALFDGLGLHVLIDRSIDVDRTADAVAALLGSTTDSRRDAP